jgi:glutamate---cysteine ligase / carboxylate-amine ligase
VDGGVTMGVEEEFLLADAVSRRTVPKGAAVLGRVRLGDLGLVHAELLASQVEASTGVCGNLAELREHLVSGRELLGAAAREEGALLLATGTPPLAGPDVRVTSGDRFGAIEGLYRGVVETYEVCGCHVHIGVPDRETAVAVVNHLGPWLPTLLALSVNSPYDGGRDTGYGSWRMVRQAAFPGAGIPPRFTSAAEYDREVARLVDCGALVDPSMSSWLARPSPRFPTVEVRVADAVMTVDEAVLQAALTRALVRTALADLERGREAPPINPRVAAAAVWSAARYGLRGAGVDPLLERVTPAEGLVPSLLAHIAEALEDTGDHALVRDVVKTGVMSGTGADRQRGAADPAAAVDLVATRTSVDAGN